MKILEENIENLIIGHEATAVWFLIAIAALWGCLFGITGLLAVQRHQADRRDGEGRA